MNRSVDSPAVQGCCRARTTRWKTAVRKYRPFADGLANVSNRPVADLADRRGTGGERRKPHVGRTEERRQERALDFGDEPAGAVPDDGTVFCSCAVVSTRGASPVRAGCVAATAGIAGAVRSPDRASTGAPHLARRRLLTRTKQPRAILGAEPEPGMTKPPLPFALRYCRSPTTSRARRWIA